LKIVYYTSGTTGAGRVVRGICIGNALKRNKISCDYVILSSSPFGYLVGAFKHLEIPPEKLEDLSKEKYSTSNIFKAIGELKPDILLVDLIWFPLHNFMEELPCKKVFLCRQVNDVFFSIPTPKGALGFNPTHYDELLKIEPFESSIKMKQIEPIIIRNKDEIYPRKEAMLRLGLKANRKVCCIAYSGYPGDFERVKKDYSYLEDEYEVIYTSTYHDGIFPIADYFNAIDFLVCGAGYNAFWEARYFDKQGIFVPIKASFETGERRISECADYSFTENGADQLVRMLKERWM
jgi:hypothetical protein